MVQMAEFTIDGDDFPLGSIFEELPAVTVELDRIVPTSGAVLPYFWVWNVDLERVEAVLAAQPEIRSASLIDDVGDGGLFRAEWDETAEGILTALSECDVVLTRGSGTGAHGNWVFEFRVESRDALAEFQRYCTDHGLGVTINRLYSLAEMQAGGGYDLTPDQHEALVLAFEEGYYDDPKEATLEELASLLGITRPSVSSRLKRGYRNLIGSTLVHPESDRSPT